MSPSDPSIPQDWDALEDRDGGGAREFPDIEEPTPPVITLMAAAWADLVVLLAVCAGALIAILLMGERPSLDALWWAALLALLWWTVATAACVIVRHGTPGMLLAGVRFEKRVPQGHIPWVMAAALLGVATLGMSALIGDHALLRAAGRSSLRLFDGPP
jgi:hypothetical protein